MASISWAPKLKNWKNGWLHILNNAQQKYDETSRHLDAFEHNLARAEDLKLEDGGAEK